MTIFPGCKCCGPCWRCYTDGTDYECIGPDDTPQDGWTPVGKCHPDEESCAKNCPPIDYECETGGCNVRYRLSGYPLGESLCADDGRFVIGQPYTGLIVSGDLSPAFLVTNYEYDGRDFPWKLEAESADATSKVEITGGCGTKPNVCARADGLITLRPFAGIISSNPPLEIRFNSYGFGRDRESAVIQTRIDTDPLAPSIPKLLVRSVELGGNVLAQPVDASTSSSDTNLDLKLYAQNGQTTQLFNSACIDPQNWTGDLVVTVEAWDIVPPYMPSDYSLISRKTIVISWSDMINVFNEDCFNATCNALPVFSCLYKDYEYQLFEYTSLDQLPSGWVLDFNSPTYQRFDDVLQCAECCGGLEENPARGFATGHTLFNTLEKKPIKIGDSFIGSITGSMVDGLTGLKCVDITGDTYKFTDDPAAKVASIPTTWDTYPGGSVIPVDGYKCSVVSPYIPNILDNPDGTPIPILGEYDSCDECDADIQGNPIAPDSCTGDAESSKPTPQYTAEVALSPTCRASSILINFADIQPLTYIDRGPGMGFIPGGPHPYNRYTMASCRIDNRGIYVGLSAPEDTGRWIKAEFAGRTLGGPDQNAEQLFFQYCPVQSPGAAYNCWTDGTESECVRRGDPPKDGWYPTGAGGNNLNSCLIACGAEQTTYVPQDEFSGPLKITVGWSGYEAIGIPDQEWSVEININGAYDSYCWMCGVDRTLNHVVPKPSLPSPYDSGDDSRPITRSTTGGQAMPTTTTGPGTHLKNMLAAWGIQSKEKGCGCKSMEKKMNRLGSACKEPANLKMIVDHLQAEAKKRRLPFVRKAGEMLVLRAVKRFEKKS